MTLTPGRIFGSFFIICAVLICITIVTRFRATRSMVPTQGEFASASEGGEKDIYYVHGRLGTSSANSYNITVSYSYEVNGTTYRGKNISLNGNAYSSEKKAKAVIEKYLKSDKITVWYEPGSPEFAVLEKPQVDGGLWVMLLSFLALAAVSFKNLDRVVMRLQRSRR